MCFYEILGIERDAKPDQIRRAYRSMSLSLHPDKNAWGANLMKMVNEAYEVLKDPDKRKRYDDESQRNYNDNDRDDRYSHARQSSSQDHVTIKRLKKQLRDSNAKVDELNSKNAALRSQLNVSITQLSNLRESLTSQAKELRQAQSERQECAREIRLLKNKVGYFEAENRSLQDSLNDVQSEQEEMIERLNAQGDLYNELLGKKEDAVRELQEEKRKCIDAQKKAECLGVENNRLQDRLNKALVEKQDFRSRLSKGKELYSVLLRKKKRVDAALSKEHHKTSDAMNRADYLEVENAGLKVSLGNALSENRTLLSRLDKQGGSYENKTKRSTVLKCIASEKETQKSPEKKRTRTLEGQGRVQTPSSDGLAELIVVALFIVCFFRWMQ